MSFGPFWPSADLARSYATRRWAEAAEHQEAGLPAAAKVAERDAEQAEVEALVLEATAERPNEGPIRVRITGRGFVLTVRAEADAVARLMQSLAAADVEVTVDRADGPGAA